MLYQLPKPIAANYQYEALRIENMRYDGQQYTAEVVGVTNGQAVPFIFANRSGLHRVTECVITDAELDAVMAQFPEITVRLEAGIKCAMERLYSLVQS